ncbi:hypothetical protein PSQ90_05385 [Devosia rhodophyticola]|uniref:DUF2178 domain-containing protein n=1 Tax=Devosia rhodophyticola TaxID=3026423 RepID=A0ABY7Z0N5_9HYPH|nr:hypothetical protein [Devosia rhodophyticola]WDR06883.1 hypothetical protein PSQ90_05385 [Devosia rhodophyticola]
MSWEEKSTWIMGVVSVVGYAVYLSLVLPAVPSAGGLADAPYVASMLWTIGGAIIASIILHILAAVISPQDANTKDQRDREIYRAGEYIGQSFVVIGALSAMILAMLDMDQFWIANAVYLCFVLSGVLSTIAKIAMYRGFHPW